MVGRQRLGVGDVEPGAEELAVAQRVGEGAWSTTGPRDVLTRTAVGFMRAQRRGVDEVARLGGQVDVEADEVGLAQELVHLDAARAELGLVLGRRPDGRRGRGCASRSRGRGAPSRGRCARSPRCPASRRGRPRPAAASAPRSASGRRGRSRSASGMRRAAAMSSAKARSAVVSVRTPGVLPTGMPRRVQAATSMLSKPTAKLLTTFSCGPAASSSSSSTGR